MENILDCGFYNEHDLRSFGFRSVGSNVKVAKNCTVVGRENISFGSNVRVDGYTTLTASRTGAIEVGSFVHIGSYCFLSGRSGIKIGDYVSLSQAVKIYSRSDDFSGAFLNGPMVPEELTGGPAGLVVVSRHCLLGSSTVVFPDLEIGEGSAVGAMSLVRSGLDSWGIYAGIPAKRLRDRSRELLLCEQKLLQQIGSELPAQSHEEV